MKTIPPIFWPLKRRGSWRERLKLVALFFLLIGGWASIYVLGWLLDGR